MFIQARSISAGLSRTLQISALVLLAGFGSLQAQTAPQLLPYTAKLIAGGGGAIIAGATCPSGLVSTDAFGDGCLATEVQLASPRYAIADKNGNIFFSDFTAGLVRRVDVTTGIVTVVAGGAASSPASGAVCGSGTSIDADGNGCPANLVKISKPVGLAFDAAGNLFFADNGYDDVRKVAATAGVITTTGIISNIAGGSTYGYNVNNTSTSGPVNAATASYLNFPYGIAFDAAGNLYIGDEGNNAIEVVNLTAATETIQGMTIPPGTIAKIAGYTASGDCPDFVSTSSRGGCAYGKWTDGTLANVSQNDGVYSVAVDTSGNVYFNNEFNYNVGIITPTNILNNYAGQQTFYAKVVTARGPAGSFDIGSNFGLALDAVNNLYVTDASSGVVWRVDSAGTKPMYAVAGGATTVCAGATDANGDGCPALQAKFGATGTTFATSSSPGIFGVGVDAYADLFVGDSVLGVVREIASGTQFGTIGTSQTNTIKIHFAANDAPASAGSFTLTTGAANFTLGTVTLPCPKNSVDNTTDCLVPLTAAPPTPGPFTGTLKVTSQLGGVGTFALSGIYAPGVTRTAVSFTAPANCPGATAYVKSTPISITATLTAPGATAPGGTITFFANGLQIGNPQSITNYGTLVAPIYGAKLSYTFPTENTYVLTAKYSGDPSFTASSGQAPSPVVIAPAFLASPVVDSNNVLIAQSSVTAGQTALYSFNVATVSFAGSVSFACTGLPANSACLFSPQTVTVGSCSAPSVVALSITTQAPAATLTAGYGGRGAWPLLLSALGAVLAPLMIGIRRRRRGTPIRHGHIWMVLALLLASTGLMACGKSVQTGIATPSNSYTVTVTALGSDGTASAFTLPLTVK